eukprot:g28845.t1
MPPVLHRLIRSVQRRLLSFFDGTGREAENPDPLLDVVQQYPNEAAWFIKVVMFYGSVSSLAFASERFVVWLLNSTYCPSCPGLYRLSLTVVVASFVKLLMTLVVFNRCFPVRGEATLPKPRGATQELIDSLPLFKFDPEDLAAEHVRRSRDSSCAVCLCDFDRGEALRRLPCSHSFHQSCIDRWLRRNQVCPLCLRDVEAADGSKQPKGRIKAD